MEESRPLLISRGVTPLPWRQILILLVVRLADPLSFTVLFPFVYFMVRDFRLSTRESDIAYYVGFIASSFAFAQMLSAIPWGILSDRVGRRPVILLGLLGTSISLLLFGLSESLPWAITTRCICGILSGNVAVIKSSMAELTVSTNRAKGFALLPLVGGFGAILGPIIGGFLANPADKYPSLFGQGIVGRLFLRFPYLLPCGLCSAVIGSAAFVGYFLFEETLRYSPVPPEDQIDSSTIPYQCKMAILCFTGQSLQKVIHNELFPIWAATSIAQGGLGFDSERIGSIMSFCGLALLAIQSTLYKPLDRKMGTLPLYQRGFLASIPTILLFPALSSLSSTPFLYPALLTLAAIRTAYSVFNATSINLLLAETCRNHRTLGKVNGISQATSSLARALGPVICGIVYSHSLSHPSSSSFNLLGAPFTWILLAGIAALNYALSLSLDLNKQTKV